MSTKRMRTLPLPRYVDAASVDEGDTIRVTWKVGDVEHTRTGKVARILNDHGKRSRSFITADGNEIVHWTPDSRVRFTLLAEAPIMQAALFSAEGLE